MGTMVRNASLLDGDRQNLWVVIQKILKNSTSKSSPMNNVLLDIHTVDLVQ